MINYDVYGQPSTWFSFDGNVSDIKVVNFGNGPLLSYGIINNRLSYEQPIDKSLAFCGIGLECPFSNLSYYHGDGVAITHEVKQNNTNYFLNALPNVYQSYWQLSSAFTMYNNAETFNVGSWDKAGTNETYCCNWVEPVADFNPKNIVLCIYVDCKDTVNGALSSATLSEYIDNNIYESSSYVERVYAYPYIGNYNGIDTLRRTTPALAGNFCLTPSTLEYFESSYISKCNRYNSMNTKNDNSFPLLFSTINTNMQLENLIVFGDFTNDNNFTITQSDTKYWRTSYHVTVQNKNDFKEMCLKACAQYGLYFTPSLSVANGADNFTDENMYIGVLDSEGITHGEYLKGERTAEAAQAQWDTIRDSPYDYKKNDDTNYINNTLFYPQAATSAFTKSYVLSKAQVDELAQEAYNAVAQAPADDSIENYNQRYFLTSNVIDCIISLKKFPCKPYIPQGPVQPIKIGAYQTNIQAYPLAYSVQQFDFVFSRSNNNTLYPIYDDFRDYEPYTKCSISIPFCGNVEIPCAYAYRYDIKISLLVDLITGACTAFVICNDDVIETTSGNCAIDLPLSGLQSATLDSQYNSLKQQSISNGISNGLGIVGGLVAIGVGIATGGVTAIAGGALAVAGSALKGAANEQAIDYEVNHMQAPFKTISTASGNISQAYDMRCKMLMKRPVMGDYDNDVYGKTIGFACLKNGKVRDFTGLTQGDIRVDDVVNNSGMSPTDTEKQMIYNAFATGVIL
jgi:hypothetical protein